MYLRDDGEWLAEVLADVEEDLTGKTRERLIAGLHATLDARVGEGAYKSCRGSRARSLRW